ncbi:MAG: C1 family peptidase [Bacteroidales bacterium]|nr:C1 family peptidase [Bacteroidales bacterium]
MKKYFIILAILGFGCFVMNSCQKSSDVNPNNDQQIKTLYSLGCNLLPAEEYAKIPVAKEIVGIPLKTVVNLACPPVANQGQGNCIGWGTAYAARSILWHKDHVAPYSASVNIFSPCFVNYYSGVCTGSAYVSTALGVLYTKGVCRLSVGPATDCTVPTAAQIADALIYKINSYGTVTRTTAAIKAQLNAGFPVIVAGPVNNAFLNYTSGVLSTFSGSSLGGHCYCLVGYDDTKSAFKFMNSWGTAWGASGFGYIAYGYETTWWSEAYVMGN